MSSTVLPRTPMMLWDPDEVLGIPNPEYPWMTCVGWGSRKQKRCGWELRGADTLDDIRSLVEELSMKPMNEVTQDELFTLAELCVCQRWHQDQVGGIARGWWYTLRRLDRIKRTSVSPQPPSRNLSEEISRLDNRVQELELAPRATQTPSKQKAQQPNDTADTETTSAAHETVGHVGASAAELPAQNRNKGQETPKEKRPASPPSTDEGDSQETLVDTSPDTTEPETKKASERTPENGKDLTPDAKGGPRKTSKAKSKPLLGGLSLSVVLKRVST